MKIELKIIIESEYDLDTSIENIYETFMNMKARLEGYHTDVPKLLEHANLRIDKIFYVNDEEKNIFEEIKNRKNAKV